MLRTVDTSSLRHTSSVAKALAGKIAACVQLPPSSAFRLPTVLEPSLPLPPPITSHLLALGVDDSIAQRISSALSRVAIRLKDNCEVVFKRRQLVLQAMPHYFETPKQLASVPSTFHAIYNKTIEQWTAYVLRDFVPRLLHVQHMREQGRSVSFKRPFNQSAVPLLDRFFNENAFPTRLEKHELALQCSMDYRQIHVWFQNRRSRCRKEGKLLNQREANGDLSDELENSLVDMLLPIKDEETILDDAGSDYSHLLPCYSGDSLNPPAPPHAFPSPYPPLCLYDPFPAAMTRVPFALPWPRVTTTKGKHHEWSSNISDITSTMAHLTINDPSLSTHHGGSARSTLESPVGFVTYCPLAPHPALIRSMGRSFRRRSSRRFSSTAVPCTSDGKLQSATHRAPSAGFTKRKVDTHPFPPNYSYGCPASRPGRRSLSFRIPCHLPALQPVGSVTTLPCAVPPLALRTSSVSSSSSTSGSDTDSPLHSPSESATELAPSPCAIWYKGEGQVAHLLLSPKLDPPFSDDLSAKDLRRCVQFDTNTLFNRFAT